MPHELEQFPDGTTAFASARLSAWHRLGTVSQKTMKAEQIMAAAKLGDWGVRTIRTVGIDIVDGVEVKIPADDKRMTVRRNPVTGATEYLGIVGTDYTVVQNEQCAEMLDRLVDQVGRRPLRDRRQPATRQERIRHDETAHRDGDRRSRPDGSLSDRHHQPRFISPSARRATPSQRRSYDRQGPHMTR